MFISYHNINYFKKNKQLNYFDHQYFNFRCKGKLNYFFKENYKTATFCNYKQDLIKIENFKKINLIFEKKGENFFAICPFHSEKTPSFCLNLNKNLFYCFGCGISGNYSKLVYLFKNKIDTHELNDFFYTNTKSDNSNFNINNIEMSEFQTLNLYFKLDKFYHKNLKETKFYMLYKFRNLSNLTMKILNLGYSNKKISQIINCQENHEYLRLLKTKTMKYVVFDKINKKVVIRDIFNERLVIPIRNIYCLTLGFGARTINSKKIPKYLNSKENKFFKKKKILFSEEIKSNISLKSKCCLICEGYLDSITLFQNGIRFSVASLGGSSNNFQIFKSFLISDYFHTMLFFDFDNAGKLFTFRLIKYFLKLGKNDYILSAISLSDLDYIKDPDEYLTEYKSQKLVNCLLNNFIPIYYWIYLNSRYTTFSNNLIYNEILKINAQGILTNSTFNSLIFINKFFHLFLIETNYFIQIRTIILIIMEQTNIKNYELEIPKMEFIQLKKLSILFLITKFANDFKESGKKMSYQKNLSSKNMIYKIFTRLNYIENSILSKLALQEIFQIRTKLFSNHKSLYENFSRNLFHNSFLGATDVNFELNLVYKNDESYNCKKIKCKLSRLKLNNQFLDVNLEFSQKKKFKNVLFLYKLYKMKNVLKP
ncbi:DNA primase [Guillardia theta]|uniref:DNA primase n=1 Tax=Guillardia theta TaxID=55529 RepID=Q9AW16_GUITH|nr:DNA primase [Guillardia theta]CAC27055.1 DNA primase [Guillardia theta]|mmetsp:Transcript_23967/g.77921  ORF Transcript_23967/g.77921 Transcript_23967/m.77921 type:complete len:652 (-) Transcript_23967:618-2573(-)